MPRRPMDSSCLWLPPVLAVRCTLLARPAPSDGKPSATAAPVFRPRYTAGQPALCPRFGTLVSYRTLAPSKPRFELFPPFWLGWLPASVSAAPDDSLDPCANFW